ncbi:hypothetical protein Salat_0091400 [Sesamum alatum]|uniref:Uncharacterized protein n=1 Tax=Sesamum alatum TaxID=300844 RepID=A0AAE1YWJ6_9LAMI|nr:hypothetical protein Salat_0091400 [Sesamum alatum]
MALSPLRSKAFHHGRLLSLPSRSHPAMSQFDEKLSRVRAAEASCSSLSSMNNKLKGLKSLYGNADHLLLLPHVHRIISQESRGKWVTQILDGYIKLLDACSSAKDLISQTKQDVQELLSALRRKDVQGIRCYLTSRMRSKKMIQKFFKH